MSDAHSTPTPPAPSRTSHLDLPTSPPKYRRRAASSAPAAGCVRYFNREHPSGLLSSLHCSVLGLGDSNLLLDRQTTDASHCNQVAQKLQKRFLALGATRFCAYGEADDRTNNAEVQPWLNGFGAALADVAGLQLAIGETSTATVPVSMISAFKTLVSIAVECEEYSFEKADAYKAIVKAAMPKPKKEEAPAADAPAAEEAPAAQPSGGGDY